MTLKDFGWQPFFSRQFSDFRAQGYEPARVLSAYKKTYILGTKTGEMEADARGIMWYEREKKTVTPVVGDWVAIMIRPEEQKASISTVLKRKTCFSRKVSGGRKRTGLGETAAQVIAANIDLAFIVIGLDRDFNLQRLERYMALVQSSQVKPVIILNKADLCPDYNLKKKEIKSVFPKISVSILIALEKKQVSKLEKYFSPGLTTAVLGSSGVGKSTLINQLVGYKRQAVNEISRGQGKGQHTTSRRELILLPKGGLIMDNPGMREIQLWADEDDLHVTFSDIEARALHCRFRNCRHQSEPGCAVKAGLEEGMIDQRRLENYLKIKKEIRQLNDRKMKRSQNN